MNSRQDGHGRDGYSERAINNVCIITHVSNSSGWSSCIYVNAPDDGWHARTERCSRVNATTNEANDAGWWPNEGTRKGRSNGLSYAGYVIRLTIRATRSWMGLGTFRTKKVSLKNVRRCSPRFWWRCSVNDARNYIKNG